MGMFDRWFGTRQSPEAVIAYEAVVATARRPHWYLAGAVPDTIDGRFDMIAAVLVMLSLRLEQGEDGAAPAALLTERFVDDMDGQLRQIGFGDVVVGKQIGKMMAMLGGRLGAYREGLERGDSAFDAALVRNLYRGVDPGAAALDHVRGRLRAFRAKLDGLPVATLMAGQLP